MDKVHDVKNWINQYYDWLKSKTFAKDIGDWVEISTPFLDRHNDGIVIYTMQDTNGIIHLSDDGYTIDDFQSSGFSFTKTRQKILEKYLQSFGVELIGNELTITATVQNFPQKKHFLIQCILAVNDMFEFSRNNVASAYLEDIIAYLDDNDIRYTSNIQMQGKSGLSHHIDFVVSKSKSAPERILCAVSNPDVQKAKLLMFALNDIKAARTTESKQLVMLNDNKKVKDDIIKVFQTYDVEPLLWSQRNNINTLEKLTA